MPATLARAWRPSRWAACCWTSSAARAKLASALARARSAGGPLAEGALAREVEATSRAGDTVKSREVARAYQHLHPSGRRAKAVSRFGGLA